jgi:hypothetical protein
MTAFSGGCNSALQEATVGERGLLTCVLAGARSNEPHMAAHKFKVGQSVRFTPGKMTPPAGGQAYTILRALPAEDGEYRYRIKSVYEPYERIARESELSALQG